MGQKPDVKGFFDEATNTVSYVVRDPASQGLRDHRFRAGLRPGIGAHVIRIRRPAHR